MDVRWMRAKLALVFVGGSLTYTGFQEHSLAEQTPDEPLRIELDELEAGQRPQTSYIEVGPHYKYYDTYVYTYETRENAPQPETPGPNTRIQMMCHPAYSRHNPFVIQMRAVVATYPDLEEAPEEAFPELANPDLVICTKRFKTAAQLPDGLGQDGEPIHGIAKNGNEGLDLEDRRLLKEYFPDLDFQKLVVLEEGRSPMKASQTLGMMGFGAFLSLLGLGSMFARRR